MSRIARTLITPALLLAAVTACKSQEERAREERADESTLPAQTTRSDDRAPTTAPADRPGGPLATPTPTSPTTPATPPPTSAEPPPAGQQAAGVTDVEIVSIASTAHTVEIEAAKLVLGKTQNPEVKEFAQMMVDDHTAALQKGNDLASRLELKPTDNDQTRALKDDAEAMTKKLDGLSGAELDKAYMEGQIAAHQKVLDDLDSKLIPNARNADLKAMLTETRPKVASHLEHARSIAAKLESPKAGAPPR